MGKWHLIVDFYLLRGLVSLTRSTQRNLPSTAILDQVIGLVSRFSRGAVKAKFDVKSAYCSVPVHPWDHYLLDLKWRNQYYVDLALPFRLRSTPCIFNAIADMVEWILVDSNNIPALLHYLDDFITTSPLDSPW